MLEHRNTRSRSVRRRLRRASRRAGMTLIEVMIVMVIMALMAAGAGFMILPQLTKAKIKQTGTDAKTIASAAEMFMAENEGCPSIEDLIAAKVLSDKKATKDAWDHDYQIECGEDGPVVTSAGPDGEFGTNDDIQ